MVNFSDITDLVAACTPEQKQELLALLRTERKLHRLEVEWRVSAEVILEAIARAPELTRRMFRGILAEAACKVEVIDKLAGWVDATPPGNLPYDFLVKSENREIRIQAKLARQQAGAPLRANKARGLVNPDQYVVETQKTRSGQNSAGETTRAYRFGEFDILAVCMEPVTQNWADFRFTVERWLIPSAKRADWIAVYQPVSLQPDDDWTDSLATCIEWFQSGQKKTIRGGA